MYSVIRNPPELCEIFANLFSTVSNSSHPDETDMSKRDFVNVEKHKNHNSIKTITE